ncbi:MAG TPA: FAD:protein FMN transferase, partial [Dissulfurispiraceae bacterium]|nr:FAD:protein FMN transferase [Dissulfurispiraceae bacterium]
RLFKESRISLHTLVSISVVADSEQKARTATDAAYQELDRLAKLLNFYADTSEISEINRNAGMRPVKVSKETLEAVEAAIYAGDQTEGGFDVTVGPLVRLWDFNAKTMPSATQVREKLPVVGYKNIVVNRNASTVFLRQPGMQIDLGGIIKGFAADKAAEILQQHGIPGGIVAAAGDIKLFGKRADGKPWEVGIQNPRQSGKDDELLATVSLETSGISTSGDYQRYFIENGKRYNHILNPKTGFPATSCQSVTVIAPSATLTDSLSTGIFVMGPEKGIQTLERLKVDGVIVDANGVVLMTKGIKEKIRLLRPLVK